MLHFCGLDRFGVIMHFCHHCEAFVKYLFVCLAECEHMPSRSTHVYCNPCSTLSGRKSYQKDPCGTTKTARWRWGSGRSNILWS